MPRSLSNPPVSLLLLLLLPMLSICTGPSLQGQENPVDPATSEGSSTEESQPAEPTDEQVTEPVQAAPSTADLEAYLDGIPSAERLADWHDRFSSVPHVAGSEGDARLIEKMAGYLGSMGLEVETHRFTTYLSKPISAKVQIVAEPETISADARVFGASPGALPLSLPIREPAVDGDSYMSHPDLDIGWNAYSGSGDVTAEVVYANYGTLQDFYQLRRLGIDISGKIVLARYGGNFRGFKAKFAEEAGAAGLILFTDPADSGYAKGPTYPQGGWAGAGYIQRGSLKTLPYSGDPLTPFEEATPDAERLDPDHVALPRIPVQPIGWGAAFQILRRMTGDPVPEGWQGGLPLAYRLGGPGLEVRLKVQQERQLVETANVLGFLRGAGRPDEWVVVGSHHDAWSFGAGDPNAGTILVFEAARAFADAAKNGLRPDRTVVFANWGAEEFGIIGSTEWVEGRREELAEKAIGYINLDGAAMGTQFRASSSPSLKALVAEATRHVPQAGQEDTTVYEAWVGDGERPPFGNLGGGSDHVGFYCHLAIPSVNLSAGGSPGVSYHSNYENLAWYRKVVGDDYEGAVMLTRVVNRVLAGLTSSPLLPLDPIAYGTDLQSHLQAVLEQAEALDLAVDLSILGKTAELYEERAIELYSLLVAAVLNGQLVDEGLDRANRVLLQMERQWLHQDGLPERPWFRNLFAATDPTSGYGAWMLPALRWVVEQQRPVPPLPEPAPPVESDAQESEEGDEGFDELDGAGGQDDAEGTSSSKVSEDTASEGSASEGSASEEAASEDKVSEGTVSEDSSETAAPPETATGLADASPSEISGDDTPGDDTPGDDTPDSDTQGSDIFEGGISEGETSIPAPSVPDSDFEQAQLLYLDALDRLSASLDELQALLPGQIVPEVDPRDDVTDEPTDGGDGSSTEADPEVLESSP